MLGRGDGLTARIKDTHAGLQDDDAPEEVKPDPGYAGRVLARYTHNSARTGGFTFSTLLFEHKRGAAAIRDPL